MPRPLLAASSQPSAIEYAQRVRSGALGVREGIAQTLTRIAERNPELNAFARVFAQAALAEAERVALDPDLPALPLAGVPVAVKGDLAVAGFVTTQGGRTRTRPELEDSEVVRRLRAAGAIIMGTTVLPEFGQFAWSHSDAEGTTRNPWDASRTPGGSSCGSAVAVASGMVPLAIGSDAGGSVRIPAACCGIVGLKPTRGRVSSAPEADVWVSLGTHGPLARTVADTELALRVIAGNTDTDRWALSEPLREIQPSRRLRVGAITRPADSWLRVDDDVLRGFSQWVDGIADSGHDVRALRRTLPGVSAFQIQMDVGIRASLASADRPELAEPWSRMLARWGRVMRPAEGLTLWLGRRARTSLDRLFERFDVLVTPTLSVSPPPLDYLAGVSLVTAFVRTAPLVTFTRSLNVSGHPAMSLPVASDGLPLGAQIIGPWGREDLVLGLAAEMEDRHRTSARGVRSR